jgi:DNA-binding NarL/FixJ family response regulator
VRIVIAEDALVVRQGLVALLGAEPDLEVVAAIASYDELLAAVATHRPDVVLTDIRMPPTGTDEGIRAAAELRTRHPEVGVVVLSQHLEPSYALALLGSGTDRRGYLLKERVGDVEQLLAAVRSVAEGGAFVDPLVIDTLLTRRGAAPRSPLSELTEREQTILAELATGRSNAAIAARLALSERTIEKHINTVFTKLGLEEDGSSNRRVKAVLLFLAAAAAPGGVGPGGPGPRSPG